MNMDAAMSVEEILDNDSAMDGSPHPREAQLALANGAGDDARIQ